VAPVGVDGVVLVVIVVVPLGLTMTVPDMLGPCT